MYKKKISFKRKTLQKFNNNIKILVKNMKIDFSIDELYEIFTSLLMKLYVLFMEKSVISYRSIL